MELIYTFVILVVGLAVGSFIGAFTYRFPKGISVAQGRSFCPHCKAKIVWYDNIPILSYLFLGGKCRNCGGKISLRYPAIEGAVALGFLYLYTFPCSPGSYEIACIWNNSLGGAYLPFIFFVFSVLVTIFVIDLESQTIPDSLVFTLFVTTSLILILNQNLNLFIHLASGFVAALFLLFLFLITRQKGMGLGDVKLALFAGTFLGFPGSLTWLFASFIMGAIVGLLLILVKKASFGKHIPFGPFLVVSFFIVLVLGDSLLNWLGV